MHTLLRSFSIILLDLNGTFMFGHDRFGADQDYLWTYRSLGGRFLNGSRLGRLVESCYTSLDCCYRDPAYSECFPSVASTVAGLPEVKDLSDVELDLVERVIGAHEVGTVSDEYAQVIRRLSVSHRLAIVSNIWSRKELYVRELQRAGILDLFGAVIFSSDGKRVKPSRALFNDALRCLGATPGEAVVVGDSLRCDIGGAAAAGIASVWIDSDGKGLTERDPVPTWIIQDLRDLSTV